MVQRVLDPKNCLRHLMTILSVLDRSSLRKSMIKKTAVIIPMWIILHVVKIEMISSRRKQLTSMFFFFYQSQVHLSQQVWIKFQLNFSGYVQTWLLKLFAQCLTVLVNTGIFPNEWKCSKVVQLHKQGDPQDLNNNRPISVIPVVAKIFKRIVYDEVNAFLTNNDLIYNNQFGFRRLHSTAIALVEATNELTYNIDCGNINALVCLELKEACDTVDHGTL